MKHAMSLWVNCASFFEGLNLFPRFCGVIYIYNVHSEYDLTIQIIFYHLMTNNLFVYLIFLYIYIYNSSFGLLGLFGVSAQVHSEFNSGFKFFFFQACTKFKICCPNSHNFQARLRLLELSLPKLHPYMDVFEL